MASSRLLGALYVIGIAVALRRKRGTKIYGLYRAFSEKANAYMLDGKWIFEAGSFGRARITSRRRKVSSSRQFQPIFSSRKDQSAKKMHDCEM